MADKSEGAIGCFGSIAFMFAVVWFVTKPSDDQVCRSREVPIMDGLHGVDWQPTCQAMIDRMVDQADDAQRKTVDLEDRVAALERRLDM